MSESRGPRPGVATIWFVTAAEPLSVLAAEPGHDRGFGRKYLALLDPRLPITPIGDFPLNRSAPAGPGEFYIGGYDGLAVVQTVLDDVAHPSELPRRYLRGIAATDVYVFSSDDESGFGAFAHFRAGELKRAFSATPYTIIEDIGVPAVSEGDYWAGKHRRWDDDPNRGVAMPFVPSDLSAATAAGWLGFDPADPGPDIPVSAFAVDGRRAPALDPVGGRRGRPGTERPASAEDTSDYDDYEVHAGPGGDSAQALRRAGRAVALGAKKVGGGLASLGRAAWAQVQRRNRS